MGNYIGLNYIKSYWNNTIENTNNVVELKHKCSSCNLVLEEEQSLCQSCYNKMIEDMEQTYSEELEPNEIEI